MLPGSYTITGLAQGQLYLVFYVDPNFAGGAVTPIATQNPADYLGKVGYFKIDSVITPVNGSGGVGGGGGGGSSATRYSPAVFHDFGDTTTQNPGSAFDGDSSSFAKLTGTNITSITIGSVVTTGEGMWQTFPNVVTSGAGLLTVIAGVFGHAPNASITVSGVGTDATLYSGSNASQTSYTLAVPSGTNLGGVSVDCSVSVTSGNGSATLRIYEIYIDA